MVAFYFSTQLTTLFKINEQTNDNKTLDISRKNAEQAIHVSQLIYSCLGSVGYFTSNTIVLYFWYIYKDSYKRHIKLTALKHCR